MLSLAGCWILSVSNLDPEVPGPSFQSPQRRWRKESPPSESQHTWTIGKWCHRRSHISWPRKMKMYLFFCSYIDLPPAFHRWLQARSDPPTKSSNTRHRGTGAYCTPKATAAKAAQRKPIQYSMVFTNNFSNSLADHIWMSLSDLSGPSIKCHIFFRKA